MLWLIVKSIFFQNAFPWPPELRSELLRAFGGKIGKGVVIKANVNISFPWRLTIADHVWIGEDVGILTLAPVVIGANVCISQRAFLCTGSHDRHREDFALKVAPITIGNSAWVAAMSFIAPGVTIGENAVVSAGSVVFQDIPPNALVRGNPAQPFSPLA